MVISMWYSFYWSCFIPKSNLGLLFQIPDRRKCLLWRRSYLKLLAAPILHWLGLPKDLNSSDLPKHKEPTRSFHSRTVIRYCSKESHCLQVELSTTFGLKTIWRPGACSCCRSSVVHLGLNDWWTTWQRLTASLIAAISHATANGSLNVTSLFKGPRQQTETNLKTTATHKYVHRLFKPKSTIYWRHRACRFSTQLLLWL